MAILIIIYALTIVPLVGTWIVRNATLTYVQTWVLGASAHGVLASIIAIAWAIVWAATEI